MLRDLLSPAGLRRLTEDVLGPQGTDVAMSEEEAIRFAGPPPEPLGATVLCPTGRHEIRDGSDCPVCTHGCASPGNPSCPGNETP